MLNPIAVAIMAAGFVLLFLGIRLMTQHHRKPGLILACFGLSAIATPFVITFRLIYP